MQLASLLGTALTVLLKHPDSKRLRDNWLCAVCMLQTTALFVHEVFENGLAKILP